MYRNCSMLLAPLALTLAAVMLAGCASDGLFFEDDAYAPNSGSRLHPIKIVQGRAQVEKCGAWPDDVGDTTKNELPANYGCAVQNNIAAMAARPADVVGKGEPLAPPLGDVGYTAIRKLTIPASTSSP